MERIQAESALYNLLAAPLYGPNSPAWPAVRSGEWTAALGEVLAALKLNLALPQPGPEIDAEFLLTFAAPGHPLMPVESVHKPWTEAPGAEMTFAREKGWLGGDPAGHMAWLFAQAGIEIPPAMTATPDHLALELEFMGLLTEFGSPEQRELFRSQHLDWVATLAEQAEAAGVSPFYRELLQLTAATVAQN